MSKFVKFVAEGVIYDKLGEIESVRTGSGVTLDYPELMGKVFRQCPNLLPCDYVDVRTEPIG